MSSYSRMTKNPKTGEWAEAQWLDNYFGNHRYGVKFPDGEIFRADNFEWETRDSSSLMKKKKVLFSEATTKPKRSSKAVASHMYPIKIKRK